MIKAILFDLDGTLLPLDQQAFIINYFKRLAGKLSSLGYDGEFTAKCVFKATDAMIANDGRDTNENKFWMRFEDICEKTPARAVICTPKVGHFWRCIFL